MTLRAIIADDEPLSVDMLRVLISEIGEDLDPIEIIDICKTGDETLTAVRSSSVDLLFLDINMPAGDGMFVAKTLQDDDGRTPLIIFTTAHAEFAAEAFKVEAIDYLLKPIKIDRLRRAVERAFVRHKSDGNDHHHKTIPVPVLGGIEMVSTDSIEWVEASGDYIRLHVGSRSYLLRKTLSAFAQEIAPLLRQTHRSYLIKPSAVEKVIPKAKGEALLRVQSGAEIPVSRRYKDVLDDLLS